MTTLDPRRLLFVIGPPRGGTTLLMRLLHLDVWGRVCLEGSEYAPVRERLNQYVRIDPE